MEQKFDHARDLRDQLGVTRPILLDALDGAWHPGGFFIDFLNLILLQFGFTLSFHFRVSGQIRLYPLLGPSSNAILSIYP
jgi:hypothetical protein